MDRQQQQAQNSLPLTALPQTSLFDLVMIACSTGNRCDLQASSNNLTLVTESILIVDQLSNLVGVITETDLLRGVALHLVDSQPNLPPNSHQYLNASDLLKLQLSSPKPLVYRQVERSITPFQALAIFEQDKIEYFLSSDLGSDLNLKVSQSERSDLRFGWQVYGLTNILQDLQHSSLLKSARIEDVIEPGLILLTEHTSFSQAIAAMLNLNASYLVLTYKDQPDSVARIVLFTILEILQLWLSNHQNAALGETSLYQLSLIFEPKNESSKIESKFAYGIDRKESVWAAYREMQRRQVKYLLVIERSLLNQSEKPVGVISLIDLLKPFKLESMHQAVESLHQNLNRVLSEKAALLLKCIDRVGGSDLTKAGFSQYQLEQEYKIALATLQIRQSFSLDEILETTASEVASWLQSDRVLLYQFCEDGEVKIVAESVTHPQWSIMSQPLVNSFLESGWQEFYDHGIARVIDDLTTVEMLESDRQFLSQFEVKSSLVVGIPQGKKLWGLLIIHQCSTTRQWEPSEIEFIERLAPRLSINFHQAVLLANSLTEFDERRQVERKLFHNALHDPLTDLPNRILISERLEFLLKQSTLNFALLLFDLNRFKLINDGLGHLVGDRVLLELVSRLTKILSPTDMLARIGGDEFVILSENLLSDQEQSEQVIQIIDKLQTQLQQPFNLIDQSEDHSILLTISIGIVFGQGSYLKPSEILRDADAAMHHAKAQAHPNYAFFTESMRQGVLSRLHLERDLRQAFKQKDFSLYYQPIILPSLEPDLNHKPIGQVVGFEALLRWTHCQRGFVYPQEFIPVIEETGLIVPIGDWVLLEACQQMRQWQVQFPQHSQLTISVNVSNVQVEQPNFVETVQRVLQTTGLSPNCLHLEITESVLIQNITNTHKKLEALRLLGVEIHIDDFGTGYSSFSYLQNLPIDGLKIDRSFISRITEDESSGQIVQTIINLAEGMGKNIVAEGVETEAQLLSFMQMGKQNVQGYYFSKPVSAERASQIIENGLPKLP